MASAIVLFSGGMDSLITVRLLQEQGVAVTGLHIVTPFHNVADVASEYAKLVGIEMVVATLGDDYLTLIQNPQWGYGKAINPCIDCRVEMCRVAKELMIERNADFVATGEVNGQRPNSQKHHQLDLITRESGLDGRLVRPLSAKTLPITRPEEEGIIDRNRLLAFTGRARRPLIRLAHELGIRVTPQPSVGCLLCEKSYAPKLRDLFRYNKQPTVWDIDLLNSGRHIRIDETLKVTVARNEAHCKQQEALFKRDDRQPAILLTPENFFGPSAVLTGSGIASRDVANMIALGGSLILRFTPPEKRAVSPLVVRTIFGDRETCDVVTGSTLADQYHVIGEAT
ncbi:MAG: hypothetical protein ACRC46_04645 [Thermoguttaceae bacterium]